MELRIRELLQGVNFESGEQFSVIIITNGVSDTQVHIKEDDVPAILGLLGRSAEEGLPDPLQSTPAPAAPSAPADPMFTAVMGEDAPSPAYPAEDDYARSPADLLASSQEETTDPGEVSSRVRVAQI